MGCCFAHDTENQVKCLSCGKSNGDSGDDHTIIRLKRCIRCKIALYCSVQCQARDWSRHSKKCSPPQQTAQTTPLSLSEQITPNPIKQNNPEEEEMNKSITSDSTAMSSTEKEKRNSITSETTTTTTTTKEQAKKGSEEKKNEKIEDYYTILDDAVLGSGISSVVKVCVDNKTKEECAVKIITKKNTFIDEGKFREEIRLLQKIKHKHIIQLKKVFETQEFIYIVTELASGGELFDRILDQKHFSEQDAADLTRAIMEGVSYLHSRGIVHRDLKPENVLFSSPDKDADLKISDFGFAEDLMNNKSMLQAVTQLGTKGYAAPEIFSAATYDEKCDVWSIGVIAYIMLSGLPPFVDVDENAANTPFWIYVNQMSERPTTKLNFPSAYWREISDQAQHFCSCCLELDPRKRARSTDLLSHPWLSSGIATSVDDINSSPQSPTRTSTTSTTSPHTPSRSPLSTKNLYGKKQKAFLTMTLDFRQGIDLSQARALYEKRDSKGLNKLLEEKKTVDARSYMTIGAKKRWGKVGKGNHGRPLSGLHRRRRSSTSGVHEEERNSNSKEKESTTQPLLTPADQSQTNRDPQTATTTERSTPG